MSKSSFIAPVPYMHLDGAIELLKTKPFALFGTEAFGFFEDVEVGAKVLIYRSHEEADLVVSHQAVYRGFVGDMFEMRRLQRSGYRPPSTEGENWPMYWKCSDIQILTQPLSLTQVQLVSGKYMTTYPRGPMETAS